MAFLKKFVRKYGIGLILGSVILDGYRRLVLNDRQNNVLDNINEKINSLSGNRDRLRAIERDREIEIERIREKEMDRERENNSVSDNVNNNNNNSNNNNSNNDSNFTANSSLEEGELNNILMDVLDNLFNFNVLELIVIIIAIWFIFNIFFKNKIYSLLGKYIPSKFKIFHKVLNKLSYTSGKIDGIIVLGILVILLLFQITNVYICYKLRISIDDLVYFYNEVKKNSVLLLIMVNNSRNIKNIGISKFKFNTDINTKNYSTMNNDNLHSNDGVYEKYYKNILDLNDKDVTSDFMVKYYPDHLEDEIFIKLLMELPIEVRGEKESIIKLYN